LYLLLLISADDLVVTGYNHKCQATQRVPFTDCPFVSHSVRWYCSWPWCTAGQRTIHAKTHQQGRQHVFLPSETPVSDTELSVETSWRRSSHHSSSHVSTTVIPCSPAYLHPHWCLYNVYRTRLLDWCLISTNSCI